MPFSDFTAIAPSPADAFQVPEGYRADLLMRFGDEFANDAGDTFPEPGPGPGPGPDGTRPRVELLSPGRQSLSRLRTRGLSFRSPRGSRSR